MTLTNLLIASSNPGKIREIKEILNDIPYTIISLLDLPEKFEIEENGNSYEENAVIKAKTVGEKTGMITLGEDSGLEVDALGGRPGLLSARYAEGSDTDRNNKLLEELKGIPKEKRIAMYKAAVAVYDPMTKRAETFEGMSEGYITDAPSGTYGFGYDPIFYNKDLGKTNGEASLEEKNRVSHRARALERVKNYLR